MKIIHLVNQRTYLQHVVGETGYAVHINSLVAELSRQGHRNDFRSLLWSDDSGLIGHAILHDAVLGHALYHECALYDMAIIHATTPLPVSFVRMCRDRSSFRLIVIAHDPVFCDVTYGYNAKSKTTIPMSRWTQDYLFNDHAHIAEIKQKHAPNDVHMSDVYTLFKLYIELFNCATTICPSPQVATLLTAFGVDAANLSIVPHAIPYLTHANGHRSDDQIVSVMSWHKVDYWTTLEVAARLPDRRFHLVCSDLMRDKFDHAISSNVTLVPIMPREAFFAYIEQHHIGLCLHLSRIFETFALLPYEMAQLGVRTTMPDNESGLTQAILFNHLEQFSVDIDYTTQDVIVALRHPTTAWSNNQIEPLMRIERYARTLLLHLNSSSKGESACYSSSF